MDKELMLNLNAKYEKLSEYIHVCVTKEHRFGTDAFLLADFTEARQKDNVCDLGTGCGIIPLIMSRGQRPPKLIYAVDIQPQAIKQVELGTTKSLELGGLVNNRIIPICADMSKLWSDAPIGQLDVVTCNPPYKLEGTGIESALTAQRIARHEILCTIDDVCNAGKQLLKFGGKMCICNRPERLADVMESMRKHNLEPKRLCFVSKNDKTVPWLFLIEGKKGSKPFLNVMPPVYVNAQNHYSNDVSTLFL